MRKFVDQIMAAVKEYSFLDYVWFKTELIFLGIILGTYFSSFFSDYIIFVWIIFILSLILTIYRTLTKIK